MALIVEDGTGKVDAEAYISVADATTYHAAYGNPASWVAASTGDKENALRVAAQYLDGKYVLRWLGTRTNEDQALDWPRAGAVDPDEWTIEDDDIPTALEQANAIAALKVIDGDTLLPDVTSAGTVSSESKTLGPLSKSTTYLGGKSNYTTYSLVDAVLKPLLRRSSQVSLA